MPVVELHGVAKLYGSTVALKTIDLVVEPGETLVLVGPNGSGKTTLLKILAGVTTPTLGRGSIFGLDMVLERASLRSRVGYLSSESYLYEDLTARENLRFVLTMVGRKVRPEEHIRVLDRVVLGTRADERVRNFSSGMKRRLCLARLVLLAPQLLLLDEPYNSLDALGAELVDEVVRGAAREGKAIVLATHDIERGLLLADTVMKLERGALVSRETCAGSRS